MGSIYNEFTFTKYYMVEVYYIIQHLKNVSLKNKIIKKQWFSPLPQGNMMVWHQKRHPGENINCQQTKTK